MPYEAVRQALYDTTMAAVRADLIYQSAGNFSVRVDAEHIAITPGGIKYDHLKPEDIAIVDLHGQPVDAPQRPSSETPMHTHIFRHLPEVTAICHTHSPYAIAFAMLGAEIPVANLELLTCGGPIPVAPWACPGTEQPGKEAAKLLRERPALRVVLLRNHGLLAVGASLEKAFGHAFDAEAGLKTYHLSSLAGTPITLTPEQIAEVHRAYS